MQINREEKAKTIDLGSYQVILWKSGDGNYNGNVSLTYDGWHPFTVDQGRINLNYHSENGRRGDSWGIEREIYFPSLNVTIIEEYIKTQTPKTIRKLLTETPKEAENIYL